MAGAEFYSVTAPSLSTVPDADGVYTLNYHRNSVILNTGEEYVFSTAVISFEILGIDTGLELDPADPLAFATGVAFTNIAAGIDSVTVSQTPITFDTDGGTSVVPLPASSLLLVGGISMLAGIRRRRRAA